MNFSFKHVFILKLYALEKNIAEFENSVDVDEPSHLELYCLPCSL